MNKIIYIVMIVCISGCMHMSGKYPVRQSSFPAQSKENIIAYANSGQKTNIDILKFLQYPSAKFMSDSGEFCYIYNFENISGIEKQSVGFNTEVHHIKLSKKSCMFLFDNNGNLKRTIYNDNAIGFNSKYDLIPISNNIDDNNFHREFTMLKNGASKGNVFRLIGKPEIVHELKNIEIWEYLKYEDTNTLKNMGIFTNLYNEESIKIMELEARNFYAMSPMTMPNQTYISYIIEIKNNKLSKKYIMKYHNIYTQEEQNVLPPIEYHEYGKAPLGSTNNG